MPKTPPVWRGRMALVFWAIWPYIGAMQKDSRLFEDLARLASGAAGTVMDMKRELEAGLADRLERWVARDHFVTRDEFEVVKAMAQKAREENAALKAELDKLKA